ncbi:MAG: PD-(D/E)XK nuclease family protein [Akkermansia sp.]|nr:PD-(D/E)XK nuclease family protein [Akkermansia sp.]
MPCKSSAALQQPDVRELFTLRPNQEVCNEQPIEAITARNEWMSGTIDRLILTLGTDGSVIGAHIIDYKTNKLVPDEQEPDVFKVLMKKYTEQMSAYKSLVSRAFGLPGQSVSVSLISCPLGIAAQVLSYPADMTDLGK